MVSPMASACFKPLLCTRNDSSKRLSSRKALPHSRKATTLPSLFPCFSSCACSLAKASMPCACATILSASRRSWGVWQRCLPAQAAKSKRAGSIKNAFLAYMAMRIHDREKVEVSSINDGINKQTSATKHFIKKGI